MALNRWTLNQLIAHLGGIALVLLFAPLGFYMVRSVSSSGERSLLERGQVLAKTLTVGLVEGNLLQDAPALRAVLKKVVSANSEVRYICVEGASGQVLAHTFAGAHPSELRDLWREAEGEPTQFRLEGESVVDLSEPILCQETYTLHVGLSRARAARVRQRMMWVMGIALMGALAGLWVVVHLVAAKVSRPLQQLEAEVARFPQQTGGNGELGITGSREVESLAKGFTDMARRLEALEQERAATQERMVHTERLAALGELAAGLAHEVHNPLHGMQESLRYLGADPHKSKRATKYYPMLEEGLDRIARVMQGMLTLARSGRQVPLEVCPLADVVESLRLLIQTHLEGRKVQVSWRYPRDCICACNREGLAQAVLNLVLNAAEAAEASVNPRVCIQATCDAQWVYLLVEDSGRGVPPKLCQRIFDPFFTTKPVGKGTGLGLSVSRELIRAAGGEIELSPEPGTLGGARFVIRLRKASS